MEEKRNPIMKKIIVLVVIAIVAAVAVTVLILNTGRPGSRSDNALEITRTYSALDILNGDTYTLEISIMGIEMTAYRRGEDINIILLGVPNIITDGRKIRLDYSEGKAFYSEAVDEDIQELMDLLNEFNEIVEMDVDAVQLISTGYAEFIGQELFYEEFREADGEIKRVFFNEDYEMYGLLTDIQGDGEMAEIVYHISSYVPQDAFDIPEGLELAREPPTGLNP